MLRRLRCAPGRIKRLAATRPLAVTAIATILILVLLARGVRSMSGGMERSLEEVLPLSGEMTVNPSGETRVFGEILGTGAALSLSDGGWVVLDPSSARLHRITADLRHSWATPGTGDGPGELRRPVGVVPWEDGFAVVDGTVRRLDRFDAFGRHRGRERLDVPGCGIAFTTTVLPSPEGGAALLARCAGPDGFVWKMALLDPGSPRRRGRTLLEVSSLPADVAERSGAGDHALAWQDRVLLRWRRGWWVGVTGGPCLVPLEGDGRACHPDSAPVPLPDSLRRRASLLAGSATLARFPPFVGVSWSERGPLLHVPIEAMSAGGRREEVAFDLLREDGTLLRVRSSSFRLFFGDKAILLADPRLEGTELQIVPWPAGERGSDR